MKKLLLLSCTVLTVAITSYFFLAKSDNTNRRPSEKPKVLLINFHPNTSGGHLPFILSILNSDLSKKFEFAVATPKTSDIYQACEKLGVTLYPCDYPGKFRELPKIISASKDFRKILKDFDPDIIHANGGNDNKIAVWNSLFLKNKPSIIRTFHSTKVIRRDPYHWLFHNKLVDANMFVSTSAFKVNGEEKGLKLNNVHIIENAVDLQKFHTGQKDSSFKEQLGIPENYFVFGSNAGLAEYKRVDLMLDALTLFPADSPFKVIVLGHGPQPWIEKAKSMGVDHFLIFPGYHTDVRPFCSLFDVGFILSTRVETSSFASREMLAMGIPLISSSFSGLKDNIEDHVNGVFVEPGNVEDIYNAMNFFLHMPSSELEQYKKNARLKAERSFDQKDQLRAIGDLYSELLRNETKKEVTYSKSMQFDLLLANK